MSMLYLAPPEQQQQLEWLDGGSLAMLLDGAATNGQLMMGRFAVRPGRSAHLSQAPARGRDLHADQGTALVWYDDQAHELTEGGFASCPSKYHMATASPRSRPTC